MCLEFKSTDYQEIRNREDKQPRMRKEELAKAGRALGEHSILERNGLPAAAAGLGRLATLLRELHSHQHDHSPQDEKTACGWCEVAVGTQHPSELDEP